MSQATCHGRLLPIPGARRPQRSTPGASLRQIFEEPHHSAPSDPRARAPTRDAPPGFTTALRVTTLGALTGFSLAPAVTVADRKPARSSGAEAIWFGCRGRGDGGAVTRGPSITLVTVPHDRLQSESTAASCWTTAPHSGQLNTAKGGYAHLRPEAFGDRERAAIRVSLARGGDVVKMKRPEEEGDSGPAVVPEAVAT